MENVEALKAELEKILKPDTPDHWLAKLEAAGVPSGPLQTVGQVVEHPQSIARNMVVGIDDPAAGPIRIAGNPIKLSNHDDPTSRGAIPRLDEHRQSILDELEKG
jgi:CoA:oxalate CoA-transferase